MPKEFTKEDLKVGDYFCINFRKHNAWWLSHGDNPADHLNFPMRLMEIQEYSVKFQHPDKNTSTDNLKEFVNKLNQQKAFKVPQDFPAINYANLNKEK